MLTHSEMVTACGLPGSFSVALETFSEMKNCRKKVVTMDGRRLNLGFKLCIVENFDSLKPMAGFLLQLKIHLAELKLSFCPKGACRPQLLQRLSFLLNQRWRNIRMFWAALEANDVHTFLNMNIFHIFVCFTSRHLRCYRLSRIWLGRKLLWIAVVFFSLKR